MGPELWLAAGLVGAAALLIAGFVAGYKARDAAADERERFREAQHESLLEQLAEALADRDRGHQAASILVKSAQRTQAALAAGTPADRRRLLREALPDAEHGELSPPAPGGAQAADQANPGQPGA